MYNRLGKWWNLKFSKIIIYFQITTKYVTIFEQIKYIFTLNYIAYTYVLMFTQVYQQS